MRHLFIFYHIRRISKFIFHFYCFSSHASVNKQFVGKILKLDFCTGKLITASVEPVQVIKETPHNMHGPSVAQIEVKKSLARMKEAAAKGQDARSRNYKPVYLPCTELICSKSLQHSTLFLFTI